MRKVKIAIWGWWQGNNLGDNWIKKTLQGVFPSATFVNTSVNNFKNFDFVICGGGGLFVRKVIAPWNQINMDKPFGVIGMGAEFPHKDDLAVQLARNAEFFYVRDSYSVECMKTYDYERSYDCTFITPISIVEQNDINLDKAFFVWRDGKELLNSDEFSEYIQYHNDYEVWREKIKSKFSNIIYDDFQTSEDDIEQRIKGCGFVISGRYHGIVAAIQKGIPFIAIDICPKIRALVDECGLSQYCIKISQVDTLDELIDNAKKNYLEIREKELCYREKAFKKMQSDIINVKRKIRKACKAYRVVHYGSYWMRENDIVNVMADDLQKVTNLKKIDLKVYSKYVSRRIKLKMKMPNTILTVLKNYRIKLDMLMYRPDFIVLNSGGLVLEDSMFEWLRYKNIATIGIELSDPDVYPYNGNLYADKFDLFYTNSKLSYEEQYDNSKVNIKLMPFAASVSHHYFMPEIERKYDIVVIGHARKDRIEIVDELSKKYSVGTYGSGWRNSLGVVNGIEHVKAINSGKMYLSFAKTVAGFTNVKVGLFEAIACKQVVVTDYMEELGDYFEIGKEVLCYKTIDELFQVFDYYLSHPTELEKVRENAYQRFLAEHTYENRWNKVIDDYEQLTDQN